MTERLVARFKLLMEWNNVAESRNKTLNRTTILSPVSAVDSGRSNPSTRRMPPASRASQGREAGNMPSAFEA